MGERITKQQRLSLTIRAEREVMRYAGNHLLWHKHVHNVTLDPLQIIKMQEMDRHKHTVDYSCRRTGKTACKELYLLEWNACNPDQELGVVAPREAQSLVNLGYHLEAIRRSEILTAFIGTQAGRPTIADSYYRFTNRSIARAYGIMAQVDGGDMTVASLEEVDDMPADRLYSRFLLMLGSKRRLGANENSQNEPQIRITGVLKGADTLATMIKKGVYKSLPVIDVHLGIEMGILDASFMKLMRDQLSPEEYLRQLMCQNVSSRNFIWEKFVRLAMQRGLKSDWPIAEPMPDRSYRKRGSISFGLDAGGHGGNANSSKWALVVSEQVSNTVCVAYAKLWPPGADDQDVMEDLIALWRYFSPDTAWGDAYGIGMLTFFNDRLFQLNLTNIDRRGVGDGESTANSWPEWACKPMRFEGMIKHQMATAVRALFHSQSALIPYMGDSDAELKDPALMDMRQLLKQIVNIKQVKTQTSYDSYKTLDSRVGDDLFDALMASIWGHVRRAVPDEPPIILSTVRKLHYEH